jgi:hypothetical protein
MKIGEVWGWPPGRRDTRYVQPTCRCGTLYHHWATKIVVVLDDCAANYCWLCGTNLTVEDGQSLPKVGEARRRH